MSAGKHTEGPWSVENRIERLVIWSGVDGRPEVASLDTEAEGDEQFGFKFQEEQEANARLIAAAPDLLDMVKALIAPLDPDEDHADADDLRERADSLIAKVEGRS